MPRCLVYSLLAPILCIWLIPLFANLSELLMNTSLASRRTLRLNSYEDFCCTADFLLPQVYCNSCLVKNVKISLLGLVIASFFQSFTGDCIILRSPHFTLWLLPCNLYRCQSISLFTLLWSCNGTFLKLAAINTKDVAMALFREICDANRFLKRCWDLKSRCTIFVFHC